MYYNALNCYYILIAILHNNSQDINCKVQPFNFLLGICMFLFKFKVKEFHMYENLFLLSLGDSLMYWKSWPTVQFYSHPHFFFPPPPNFVSFPLILYLIFHLSFSLTICTFFHVFLYIILKIILVNDFMKYFSFLGVINAFIQLLLF